MEKIENGHAADDAVAKNAEPIGDVAEDEKTQNGGKDDLRIVVDGNFAGRSVFVGPGDGKLAACGAKSGCQQAQSLP